MITYCCHILLFINLTRQEDKNVRVVLDWEVGHVTVLLFNKTNFNHNPYYMQLFNYMLNYIQ